MPSEEELIKLKKKILEVYPRTLEPEGFSSEGMDEAVIRRRIDFMIDHYVDPVSKPGIPWLQFGDNRAFLRDNRVFVQDLVIDRIHVLSGLDEEVDYTPQEYIQMGAGGIVRLFVKGEPHSANKRRDNRWRIISACDIVDQLVERVLSTAQNKREIATWMDNPSAPGLGLSDDSQLRALYDRVMLARSGKPLAEADVVGFDWSVQEWELMYDAECRADLCSASPYTRKLFMMRERVVCNSVYAIPDGTLLCLGVPGVQLSGRYNTSSTNSRIRVMIAYLVGAEWAIAMGDDCLEDFIEDALEKYDRLGHPLKMYEKRETEFSFCSHWFTSDRAYPEDGTKTLYNLLEQKSITADLLTQFRSNMRNSPRMGEFLASADRVIASGRAGGETLLN